MRAKVLGEPRGQYILIPSSSSYTRRLVQMPSPWGLSLWTSYLQYQLISQQTIYAPKNQNITLRTCYYLVKRLIIIICSQFSLKPPISENLSKSVILPLTICFSGNWLAALKVLSLPESILLKPSLPCPGAKSTEPKKNPGTFLGAEEENTRHHLSSYFTLAWGNFQSTWN